MYTIFKQQAGVFLVLILESVSSNINAQVVI